MDTDLPPLHAADYGIFFATLSIPLGIGLYHGIKRKQQTTSEYFVGDRKMSVLPVALSLMVTFESAILMIGTPGEVYVYGIQIIMETLGWFISYILTLGMVVQLIYPLRLTSAYEYLELRFRSQFVRTIGTLLGILYYLTYMGIVLFGPAIALEAVSGFPLWTSIIAVAVSAVIYTTIGGFRAVVWTDVFQTIIMLTGLFAILIQGTIRASGISNTWRVASEEGRLNFFNFDADPTIRHTFWCLTINGLFRSFGLLVNQSSVQRISSMPSQADAMRVLKITVPAFLITLSLACVEGVVAYSYFHVTGCDPLASGKIRDPNQIIPYMVMDMFRNMKGMTGIFLACLFSASLRYLEQVCKSNKKMLLLLGLPLLFFLHNITLSSGLSSLSILIYEDLVKPYTRPVSERTATLIAKTAVVVVGVIAVVIAFLISLIGGTLVQIAVSVLASFHGPLAGMFMFGAFCPWGNAKGVAAGILVGCALTFWICIGQMTTPGSVADTALHPAPTNNCYHGDVHNGTSAIMSVGSYVTLNSSTVTAAFTTDSTPAVDFRVPSIVHDVLSVVQYSVFVVGTLVSLITGRHQLRDGDERYMIPLFDHICPYLPASVLTALRCGVDYRGDKRIKYQDTLVEDEDPKELLGVNTKNEP